MADDKKGKKSKRPTAEKRMIQNEKARLRNKAFKSEVRTAIRRFEDAVAKKDATAGKACLVNVYSVMDQGVKKGQYKLNKASRTKSRLTARLAAI
ncbi:30S ribosomal protein S20 [Chlamydiales bacterium SCGC AG-110-P3]|nr:30S ribosomal protein S20 [Chlamydiales bacterium SCGC AG-110-P3]